MKRRVFVLGAGSSAFAGYPLGRDLWHFVRKNAPTEQVSLEAAQELGRMLGRDRDLLSSTSLEEVFTYLDLAVLGVGPYVSRASDWSVLRQRIVGLISQSFAWYEHCLQRGILDGADLGCFDTSRADSVRRTLDGWVSLIEEGDVIVTFNWDVLHEAALFRGGKWRYGDGYGLDLKQFSETGSLVKILKLHGSITWMQRDQSDRLPAIDDRLFRGVRRVQRPDWKRGVRRRDSGRDLVVPTYIKDVSQNSALLRVWNLAADALSGADSLIVLGYSLPAADSSARLLIAGALARNEKLEEFQVVAGSSGTWRTWQDASRVSGVQLRPRKQTFEDWVAENTGN